LSSLLFKHTEMHKYPTLETALLLLYAYASYLLAEGLALSGIVAILFCGIVMAHYTFNNLSTESKNLTTKMFEVLSTITETLVFAYLGLALFSFDSEYDPAFIFFSIVIILLARALHVFPLSLCINFTRPTWRKINFKYQIFMWFAGLRGAIAFVLALDVDVPGSTAIFTTTLVIVFFTVLVLGGATVPLLEKLKIPTGVEMEEGEYTTPTERNFFLNFDRKYFKPFFTRVPYRVWREQQLDPNMDVELSDVRKDSEDIVEELPISDKDEDTATLVQRQ
jgi:NhaP-type Na+/H+ or K+/H+ antiporter